MPFYLTSIRMIPSLDPAIFLKNAHLLKDVSPEQAEIVITRFDEALEWTKDISHLCTVYNKGPTPLPADSFHRVLAVPNQGHDIETVLRHIIQRYDSLAGMTFFCQGRICDRTDQPLYPIESYLIGSGPEFRGFDESLDDGPNFRIVAKAKTELQRAVSERTLAQFRKIVVGIHYRPGIDRWVRGDWFSISRNRIRSKPREYYMGVYLRCQFNRGVATEELWFLERCFYSMFNHQIDPGFRYVPPLKAQEELLSRLAQA